MDHCDMGDNINMCHSWHTNKQTNKNQQQTKCLCCRYTVRIRSLWFYVEKINSLNIWLQAALSSTWWNSSCTSLVLFLLLQQRPLAPASVLNPVNFVMWNLSYQQNPLDTFKSMSCHPWCAVFLKCSPFANVNAEIYVLWHLKYLDGFLARRLGLVVLGLLVLLAALGQVGVVGQAAEKRRHHGAGVHLLLHRDN